MTKKRRRIARSNRRSKSRRLRKSRSRSKRLSDKRSKGRSRRVRGRGRERRTEGGGNSDLPYDELEAKTDNSALSYDEVIAKTDNMYYKRSEKDSHKTYISVILMLFIAMVCTSIFSHGKTINEYITINEDGLDIAEKLGVGLIEYDSRIHRILDGAHSAPWNVLIDWSIIKNPLPGPVTSYNLRLDNKLQTNDIELYYPEYQDRVQYLQKNPMGETQIIKDHPIDFLGRRRDSIDYYNTRKKMDEITDNWWPKHKLQISKLPQGDINLLLKEFMPKILSMGGMGIPDHIQFSGISTVAPRTLPPRPSLHQDIDAFAEFGSASAEHDYRIMLFDRDEDYDQTWTEVAIEVDSIKADKFVKRSFFKYDSAKFIDFDVNRSDYIALIFDNNKVFHRTPPISFWNWATGNMPGKERRIVQFRISWNDYDQLDYGDKEEIEKFMNGGGYRIV